MTLKEKLAKVYETIEFIEKQGENTQQRYRYIRSADVTHTIRKQLSENRVYAEINFEFVGQPYIIARSKDKDAPFSAVNVRCQIVFHDLDSNEILTSSGLGTGADTGDKAGYKAQTGALKYALKNAFLVPDEADPEADPIMDENDGDRPHRPTPADIPDFQDARYSAPRATDAPKAAATTERPTAASVAPKNAPAAAGPNQVAPSTVTQPSSGASSAAAPSTSAVAPAAEREPGADEELDQLPTEEEMNEYRKKFKQLGDDLSAPPPQGGNLKASKKAPINVKLKVFLLSVTKADDVKAITKAQWDTFFNRVEVTRNNPEIGLVGLAKKINEANGIEEKK